MSALNLRLPDSIHRHIREIARQDGVSINAFITSAVAEKVSTLSTDACMQRRAAQSKPDEFKHVLDKVPNRSALPGDER